MTDKKVTTIKKQLSNINQNYNLKLVSEWYNCWGLTAFLLKWAKNVQWLSDWAIEDHLACHTEKITTFPKVGDILVLRAKRKNPYTRKGGIMHTAIITAIKKKDKTKQIIVIHKPGTEDLEVADAISIFETYNKEYPMYLEYSRVIA